MNTTQCRPGMNGRPTNGHNGHASSVDAPRHVLHRIATVRRQQEVSARVLAKRMNTTVKVVDQQQRVTSDLMLSDLYKWQAALDVPITDLLVEPDASLSPCIRRRAELVKIMKTVRLLEGYAEGCETQSLLAQLQSQLIEMMPELQFVESWPKVGKRRSSNDIAPIEERLVPASLVDAE